MIVWVQVVATLALMAATLFAPGFAVARRMRLSPLEKLCVSVGLSGVMVYLFQFALFVIEAPEWESWLGTGASVGLLAWCWGDARKLLAMRGARRGLVVTAGLIAWAMLLTMMVRHFGGGMWAEDWVEHYERAQYFLGRLPGDYQFIGLYWLPARPPMQNVIASFYMTQAGESFEAMQVVFAVTNALVVLPCWLAARSLVRRVRVSPWVFVAVFVTAPMFAQNVTWTWTKLYGAMYVVLAAGLYLAAWRKKDGLRFTLTFVMLAAGCLVHYSVVPYAIFIAAHFGVMSVLRKRWAVREWVITGAICVALLASWMGWTVAVYGPHIAFANTATDPDMAERIVFGGAKVVQHDRTLGGKLWLMGHNIYTTMAPTSLRPVDWPHVMASRGWSRVRDEAFCDYQNCLPMMMGSVSWIAVLWLMVRAMRGGGRVERWFWLLFVGAGVIGGVAVNPPIIEAFGIGHVCMQPIAVVGLSLLAAGWVQLPAWARVVIGVSRLVDFALGVLLQVVMESVTFTVEIGPDGKPRAVNPWGVSDRSIMNWVSGMNHQVRYIGDQVGGMMVLLRGLCGAIGVCASVVLMRVRNGRGPRV